MLIYDWCDAVVDIREQFPLDRDVTRRIAAEMGVRHPADTASGTDLVMTTDLLVDLTDRQVVRAVKPATDLDKPRTLGKLEIERGYIAFYNCRRPHSSHGGRTPDQACLNQPKPVPAAA